METHEERRLSARIRGDFKIQISDGEASISVKTVDLSTSGIRINCSRTIPLFHEISLSLALPEVKNQTPILFKCNGIVVRSEKKLHGTGYNVALAFVAMQEHNKQKLVAFLKRALSLESS